MRIFPYNMGMQTLFYWMPWLRVTVEEAFLLIGKEFHRHG
jgi:hypothetical protein